MSFCPLTLIPLSSEMYVIILVLFVSNVVVLRLLVTFEAWRSTGIDAGQAQNKC